MSGAARGTGVASTPPSESRTPTFLARAVRSARAVLGGWVGGGEVGWGASEAVKECPSVFLFSVYRCAGEDATALTNPKPTPEFALPGMSL